MSKYNWDERHITLLFPEEKKEVALSTKDLHVYYGRGQIHRGREYAIRRK